MYKLYIVHYIVAFNCVCSESIRIHQDEYICVYCNETLHPKSPRRILRLLSACIKEAVEFNHI